LPQPFVDLPARRESRDEIAAAFSDGWRIDAIEPAVIDIAVDPAGVAAWLVELARK
jgi:hypothetical protein